jgi:hypothetical protein
MKKTLSLFIFIMIGSTYVEASTRNRYPKIKKTQFVEIIENFDIKEFQKLPLERQDGIFIATCLFLRLDNWLSVRRKDVLDRQRAIVLHYDEEPLRDKFEKAFQVKAGNILLLLLEEKSIRSLQKSSLGKEE